MAKPLIGREIQPRISRGCIVRAKGELFIFRTSLCARRIKIGEGARFQTSFFAKATKGQVRFGMTQGSED